MPYKYLSSCTVRRRFQLCNPSFQLNIFAAAYCYSVIIVGRRTPGNPILFVKWMLGIIVIDCITLQHVCTSHFHGQSSTIR